jgi:blue copper oxidase
MLIVSDGTDADLGLPHDYGIDDIPLVLRDAVLEGGRLVYPQHPMTRMHGVRGASILANGVANATVGVPRGLVRLRLVNASNARAFHLSMRDGRELLWIGTDGGLLDAAVPLKSLLLAPAQRAELLVDFSSGSAAELVTTPDPTIANAGMGMMRMADPLGATTAVVGFEPSGPPKPSRIPTRLIEQAIPDAATATGRRQLTLTMGMGMMGGGMGSGRGGMGSRRGGGMGMMGNFGIDGRPFDMQRVDHEVRLGSTEIWQVSGEMMPHPFHIHGVHFHVLSRGGRSPDVLDRGRKDTVLVQEPVELVVQFTKSAERIPFMFHCHTLEHEDGGMMGQFKTRS